MSTRHLFESTDGLVVKCLRGLIAYNPSLALDEAHRVVVDTSHDRAHVSVISGGGSGHEPAWAGYVGTNLLAASVAGDVFASPSARQILAAVDAAPSDRGHILVITNYTGDCLHFGLAAERAALRPGARPCRVIICGDDVSVGRTRGRLVGRRGLAGQLAVLKVMGAAAGAGETLDAVYELGVAVAAQIVSIAASLDRCHVPGRRRGGSGGGEPGGDSDSGAGGIGVDELEIGTGPHNEPGYRRLRPAPSASELVATLLAYLLDPSDAERGYVAFAPGDEVLLLVSNFGGVSHLEMGALVDELLSQLAALPPAWGGPMEPVRVCSGFLETSLNAPAFSVSLVNLSAAARGPENKNPYDVKRMRDFFDARTNTHWESMAGGQAAQAPRRSRRDQVIVSSSPPEEKKKKEGDVPAPPHPLLRTDPARLDRMLRSAARALVAAEPDLTRWDAEMGDGDCGETVRNGALGLLAALDNNDDGEGGLARTGDAGAVLRALADVVEDRMGGTLGGLLGIFFVALHGALLDEVKNADKESTDDEDKNEVDEEEEEREREKACRCWAAATRAALASLGRYTPARVGDRTVVDALAPLADALAASSEGGRGGLDDAAVAAVVAGAESTRGMTPRLGRATYVEAAGEVAGEAEEGEEEGGEGSTGKESSSGKKEGGKGKGLPPDPGAWAAMVAIRGLREGMVG
ncbi:Dak1 domain-containing protein [Xylariaceae sp. FL0804]|nr:Dak1 domain-containing protein [Xylariaceae sp. FL0804]